MNVGVYSRCKWLTSAPMTYELMKTVLKCGANICRACKFPSECRTRYKAQRSNLLNVLSSIFTGFNMWVRKSRLQVLWDCWVRGRRVWTFVIIELKAKLSRINRGPTCVPGINLFSRRWRCHWLIIVELLWSNVTWEAGVVLCQDQPRKVVHGGGRQSHLVAFINPCYFVI